MLPEVADEHLERTRLQMKTVYKLKALLYFLFYFLYYKLKQSRTPGGRPSTQARRTKADWTRHVEAKHQEREEVDKDVSE